MLGNYCDNVNRPAANPISSFACQALQHRAGAHEAVALLFKKGDEVLADVFAGFHVGALRQNLRHVTHSIKGSNLRLGPGDWRLETRDLKLETQPPARSVNMMAASLEGDSGVLLTRLANPLPVLIENFPQSHFLH